jgi:hypothetical protein
MAPVTQQENKLLWAGAGLCSAERLLTRMLPPCWCAEVLVSIGDWLIPTCVLSTTIMPGLSC